MNQHTIAFYDAFSEQPFGGSVAAIVYDASDLSADTMQKIARETGAPATGFITAISSDSIAVRFFSTQTEYPMCGHGTMALATWLIEQQHFKLETEKSLSLTLNTPTNSAALHIEKRADGRPVTTLTLAPAHFESCTANRADLAAILGIEADDIEEKTPIELTRSDFNHLVARVNNLAVMQKMSPKFSAISDFCRFYNCDTLAVFCTETVHPENTVHLREFCPAVGTPEAPATGTTNRALACFLYRHNLLEKTRNNKQTIFVEQGYEMGRPSRIVSTLTFKDGQVHDVQVGGVATKTLEGIFHLPD